MTDHRLVEHLLTVPEAYFFEGGRTKRILLDALGDTVPPPVRYRRTKMGFETPQAAWLRGKLGAHLENCVRNSQRLSEILDTNAVANSMQACRRGQFKLPHHSLFAPGVLAIWMERFQVDPE